MNMNYTERTLNLVRRFGPMDVRALAQVLGCPPRAARKALQRLQRAGKVSRRGALRYATWGIQQPV